MNQIRNKYVSADELSTVCKKFFKRLIDKGHGFVDINDFNARLHEIIDALHGVAAVEWNETEKVGLPLVSDEYIVMIAYAEKPTVLYFDAEDGVFFEEKDDEDVAYKVTHWAEMPEAPYV